MKHLLVALAGIAVLSGCSGGEDTKNASQSGPRSENKSYKAAFSQISNDTPWRTAETKSVEEEAKSRQIDCTIVEAQDKQENQIMSLRSFIQQKKDVIFLAPKVETGWEPVLREAKRAKIPVILLDRGIKTSDDSLYVTLLSSDFVEEGRMAARWLAKKLNGKGNIVELQGTLGAAPANDRKAGFAEVLQQFPDMKITRSQTGDFKRKNGKEVMEAFLKADPNIQAVYAHNDEMALGAIQAIEEAGKVPGKDIIVVGIDGIKDAIQAIADGKMNCSVECSPLLGPGAFDAAEKTLAGKPVEKHVVTKDGIFDETNAKQALPDRKY